MCHVVNNWDMVAESLEQRVYDDIINLLTVHDIQLIVFTLEALYHLSELGEVTSNHIAKVVGSIGECLKTLSFCSKERNVLLAFVNFGSCRGLTVWTTPIKQRFRSPAQNSCVVENLTFS